MSDYHNVYEYDILNRVPVVHFEHDAATESRLEAYD
jgi:hypothetical protein